MNDRGVTLLEVIVIVTIIGILVVILGLNTEGLITRYKVESEIKTMFGDLMSAKARAMERNRRVFVSFPSATQYAIYEDTNPAPDGNDTLETASDTLVMRKTTSYSIVVTGLLPADGSLLSFTGSGLASKRGPIRLSSTASPDYDCIQLVTTRMQLNMGKWNGSSCVIK